MWSSCSYDRLLEIHYEPVTFCLGHEATVDNSVCGDGIKDSKEECDVGMPPDSVSLFFG